ncbi:MAG: hypothetical protein EXX96DRAFT_483109 [Benjaminiella poitrasii]|nr:MAG: hypothetical protein EXX96DRAFT_483109 [Benjaminiella poitrasii]
MLINSPTPTPSTSWASEMSALAERIKDDQSFSMSDENNIDRHSISQGMKLVSIAADEYEDGNESVALDIYLTGVDKIIMALPNKTEMDTKMAIREKFHSVEERVGILNLATSSKQQQQQQRQAIINNGNENKNKSTLSSLAILSRIASTINSITDKAYQSAAVNSTISDPELKDSNELSRGSSHSGIPTICISGEGDLMTRFKRLGQYMIDVTVTCAVLIKQSPLPGNIQTSIKI